MRGNYTQVPVVSDVTRFDKAPVSQAERSRMLENPRVLTAFNAGDIVPVMCFDVVPSETYSVNVHEIVRQMTLKTPTMGEMLLDIYAFFVPNRIVNHSWKETMGENSSGSWTAPSISLAPLYSASHAEGVQIPVGSVADYYGIPTQQKMPKETLQLMSDLPFRGYLFIYNEYFRDANYQPPIPFSRLNVYEGFLEPKGTSIGLDGRSSSGSSGFSSGYKHDADGSYSAGAVSKAVYGEGTRASDIESVYGGSGLSNVIGGRKTSWSALDKPLKACKLHDALTSVLPSPLRGPEVTFSLTGNAPVTIPAGPISIYSSTGLGASGGQGALSVVVSGATSPVIKVGDSNLTGIEGNRGALIGTADLSDVSAISVDDLRLGLAMQQLYELYGRATSGRYREVCHALFGIDVDDPFSDIPRMLGHVRVPLELYQTAQTSATPNDGGDTTPQGNLAGFGYTDKRGFLFHETFLEHGYVHILCVVRQRNVYPSYLAPHWFRIKNLDFYNPILANLSEQPVLLRTINPFGTDPNKTVFGYQEAWWEYRQHPDTVTGLMRSGVPQDVSLWTYQDKFDSSLSSADASFMESNAQEVLDETIAATSAIAPQFKALFSFEFDHEFPGPVYSVPGLDVV